MDSLSELARHYGSDKGGNHFKAGDTCHRYTQAYNELFENKREETKKVLEIGVAGGASLRMWRDYFPHALIYGIDNNSACLFDEGRIFCRYADQNNRSDLERVLAIWGKPKFDLIVDDGSHVTAHQISTANTLQQYLADDGYYVIEDIYEDCRPESVLAHITWGTWTAVPVGKGLGRAHCECGKCDAGEVLLVGRNNG